MWFTTRSIAFLFSLVIELEANSSSLDEINFNTKHSDDVITNAFFIEHSNQCLTNGLKSSSMNRELLFYCTNHPQGEGRDFKRILVTGGAGFVGSHLVDELMLDGHNVIVCDNFHTGTRDNLIHWFGHPKFELLDHDVVTPLDLTNIDEIYHLASPASPVHYMEDPIATIKANTLGTLNMLELARKSGARFLFASTSEIYGDPLVHPQTESYWGNTNPIGPRSCYDEGKRLGESLTMAYRNSHNVSVAIARIFNTYGPRMRPDDGRVISNFFGQVLRGYPITIYGRGEQTRSFQYVSDLVAGLVSLMISNSTGPINLGNPSEMTILSLAEHIKRLMPHRVTRIVYKALPVDDPHRRQPNISRALEDLAWRPVVSLDQGLNRTLQYFATQLFAERMRGGTCTRRHIFEPDGAST